MHYLEGKLRMVPSPSEILGVPDVFATPLYDVLLLRR